MTLKKFSYPLLIAALLLFTGCDEENSKTEPEQTVHITKHLPEPDILKAKYSSIQLQQAESIGLLIEHCSRLSNDTQEVYEPILGRYLGSKSSAREVIGGGSTLFNYKLFFEYEGEEVRVVYPFVKSPEKDGWNYLDESLAAVNLKHGEDSTSYYGICAKREPIEQIYIGNLISLRLIGDLDD